MITFGNIFSRKKKGHFYIVLDAGTYSIRSLTVEYGANGAIGLKKTISTLLSKESGGKPATKIGMRLREIILRHIKGLGKIPDKVILGLASRFAFNALEMAKKTRENKKRSVNQAEIKELLKQFVENHKELYMGSEKFILTHAEPTHLTVDGYDADSEHSRAIYGTDMELHLILNYIREDFWNELEKLRRILGGISIDVRPSHIAVASLLIHENPGKDLLLIKIGGKITEVSGVKDGVLVWTESFHEGGDNITRSITDSLNISLSRAEEIKKQYETLILPDNIVNPTREIIEKDVLAWREVLHTLLREKQFLVPQNIYLYGGGSRLKAISRALKEKTWTKDLTYQKEITITLLASENFAKNIFVNQPLRGPEDMDLVALVQILIPDTKRLLKKN